MRLHRFYIEQPLGEELVVVEKELVHQWISVFRYKSGDEVILFSPVNAGVDYIYLIKTADKKAVSLSRVSQQKNIIPTKEITLCVAVVKKDTFEKIVRHATELGVSKIVPILASRSEKKNLNMDRLNSIAREASEQSGRGNVPIISKILSFREASEEFKGRVNIFTSLNGSRAADVLSGSSIKASLVLWIGPEGGWTEEEETSASENGAIFMKLTDTVLKADTAAVSALSTLELS